jgi:hypothetical protein
MLDIVLVFPLAGDAANSRGPGGRHSAGLLFSWPTYLLPDGAPQLQADAMELALMLRRGIGSALQHRNRVIDIVLNDAAQIWLAGFYVSPKLTSPFCLVVGIELNDAN